MTKLGFKWGENWVRLSGIFWGKLLGRGGRNEGFKDWRTLVMEITNEEDEFEERDWLVSALEAIVVSCLKQMNNQVSKSSLTFRSCVNFERNFLFYFVLFSFKWGRLN